MTGSPQAAAVALFRSSGYEELGRYSVHAAEPSAVHLGKRLR